MGRFSKTRRQVAGASGNAAPHARDLLCCFPITLADRPEGKAGRSAHASPVWRPIPAAPARHRVPVAQTVGSRPKQNGRADPPAVSIRIQKFWGPYFPLLTTFFSSFPGVNLATLRAAILMVAPVCGFRPLRALRCETENVPNPIKATRSPFLRAAVTLSTVVSIAVVACAFEIPQAPAIRSTRSALFMLSPDTSRL